MQFFKDKLDYKGRLYLSFSGETIPIRPIVEIEGFSFSKDSNLNVLNFN